MVAGQVATPRCTLNTMSNTKIAKLVKSITEKQGPSKSVPSAQVNALAAGRGRVEHLQAFAEEFGYELRLERKSRQTET